MGLFNSINISATGLTAQRLRMDVISSNIANANTTRTQEGTPYRRQKVIFKSDNNSFADYLNKYSDKFNRTNPGGVKVVGITEDKSPFKRVYEPGHPDADTQGYINMPNIDIVTEMVDMISATRSYEANVTAINSSKAMISKALEIGRG